MRYDPDIHHRRSIRLRGYDYVVDGAYYVTICTHQRECLLGKVVDGEMVLSTAGEAVRSVWEGLQERFTNVVLDEFIIMPSHVHGIVFVISQQRSRDQGTIVDQGAMNGAPTGPGDQTGCVGARFIAPRFIAPHGAAPPPGAHGPPLGEIVRTFKAVSTRMLRRDLLPEFGWQRNYYEWVLRNDEELHRVRQYIVDNPLKWHLDTDNPVNLP